MELDDTARPDSVTRNYLGGKNKGAGVETKIYGDLDEYSNGSDDDDDGGGDARDDGSQKRIVGQQQSLDGMHVNVQRDFRVEVTSGGGGGDGTGPGAGKRGYVASRTRRENV